VYLKLMSNSKIREVEVAKKRNRHASRSMGFDD